MSTCDDTTSTFHTHDTTRAWPLYLWLLSHRGTRLVRAVVLPLALRRCSRDVTR